MNYAQCSDKLATHQISSFTVNHVEELHLVSQAKTKGHFKQEFEDLIHSLDEQIRTASNIKGKVIVLRFFVSDYINQAEFINKEALPASLQNAAISIIQQPAINQQKLLLWAYLINDSKNLSTQKINGHTLHLERAHYQHYWTTHLSAANSPEQTTHIFQHLCDTLEAQQLNLKENCLRTWLYVKDIDSNYQEVVEQRNQLFEQHNMTKDTHYIASTGIEGKHSDPNTKVIMDAYSIGGIQKEQVTFLEGRGSGLAFCIGGTIV